MAKKIQGYVRTHRLYGGPNDGMLWTKDKCGGEGYDRDATLVIHKGKPERVWTESEIRSMINELRDLAQAYWDSAGHGAPDMLSASEVEGFADRFLASPDVMGMAVPKSDHAE